MAADKRVREHDNDNHLVGAGNLTWSVPEIPDLNHDEVNTLAAPLTDLHSKIIEAEGFISKSSEQFSSIYIVSDIYGKFSKIGLANIPSKRLSQLQTGNHNRLFIHRLFWIYCERYNVADITQCLEGNAHLSASRKHYRAVGEWFKCSPSDAHSVVESEISGLLLSDHITRYCAMTPQCDIWRP